MKDDWFVNPKTKEEVTFIDFARSEGRFSKHFDKDGNPSRDAAARQAGPAGELASVAGTGGIAITRVSRERLRALTQALARARGSYLRRLTMTTPLATHDYTPGGLEAALEFLKRTRTELRMLRTGCASGRTAFTSSTSTRISSRCAASATRDADIVPLLQNLNTAFNPETIHNEIDAEYKEFGAGKRYPWAHDRVM